MVQRQFARSDDCGRGGDEVRIVIHNELPEPTIVHWHGIDVPNAMDGVEGMIQDRYYTRRGSYGAYRWVAVANGEESWAYKNILSICFRPDGRRLAYVVEERGRGAGSTPW